MRIWKRILSGAMAVLLGMGTAGAEGLLCVSTEDCAALLTADGQQIAAPGLWDDLFPLADSLYAAGLQTESGMRYALLSAEGRQMSDPEYEMLSAQENAVLFRRDRLYGAMDLQGKILVESEYTQLTAAGNGFLAMTDDPFDEDADEIFRITPEGDIVSTGVSSDEGLSALNDDRMPFQNPANERFGYIDALGQVIIEARFETAGRFRNGLAAASENGLLGIIGTDGQWRLAPEYDYLEIGDGVIVGLVGNEHAVVFGMDCRERFRVEGTKIEAAAVGGYPVITEGDVQRVYTAEGDELFEAGHQAKISAGLDGQLIISDGSWGASCVSLISRRGVRAERTDQHLIPLTDGRYAFIRMNTAAYYSESLDEVRYSCDYDSLRWGMIDSEGNEILPAEYTEIRALGRNRFLTIAENNLRVVNSGGNVIWSYPEEE